VGIRTLDAANAARAPSRRFDSRQAPDHEPGAQIVIGQQLGNYVVLTELGRGGMGDVYVARDTRLDRRVALKLPRRDVAASTDRLTLFQREAKAAAALNHPNIVHLYSVRKPTA
jgi:serine/threonine protein kinase